MELREWLLRNVGERQLREKNVTLEHFDELAQMRAIDFWRLGLYAGPRHCMLLLVHSMKLRNSRFADCTPEELFATRPSISPGGESWGISRATIRILDSGGAFSMIILAAMDPGEWMQIRGVHFKRDEEITRALMAYRRSLKR